LIGSVSAIACGWCRHRREQQWHAVA
jgi:hypothetical protein